MDTRELELQAQVARLERENSVLQRQLAEVRADVRYYVKIDRRLDEIDSPITSDEWEPLIESLEDAWNRLRLIAGDEVEEC